MSEVRGNVALVVGATGLIGGELLQLLIAGDEYKKVIVLARRPDAIAVQSDKLSVLTFESAFDNGLENAIEIDDF